MRFIHPPLWAHSPPREEGWTRHQENGAKPPLMERTGWSLTKHVAECVLEPWLVSDHPVCGRFGGFAAFLFGAAATPPHEAMAFALIRAKRFLLSRQRKALVWEGRSVVRRIL